MIYVDTRNSKKKNKLKYSRKLKRIIIIFNDKIEQNFFTELYSRLNPSNSKKNKIPYCTLETD